ncbi:MAG: universal stress protein [Candidatus Bathyarchaeia archaeon]
MFEKILVPIDGSENSLKALEKATQIAKKFGGKITLLHVYSAATQPLIIPEPTGLSSHVIPIMTPTEISKIAEAAKQAGNRILDDGENRVKAAEVEVEKMLVEGHAVHEIVKIAKEGNYDLIILGARGISHIKEMFLGSVTDGVIHHATCPVLVIK